MINKAKVGLWLLTLMGVLLVGTTLVTASGFLKPINSQSASVEGPEDIVLVGTITLPPADAVYTNLDSGKLVPQGNYPIAVLSEAVASYAQPVAAFFPDLSTGTGVAPDEIGFTIVASVRYTTENGDIYLTTTVPSPLAAQKNILMGGQEIQLTDGKTAWINRLDQGDLPNRLLFVDGEVIVSIASKLSIDRIESFATNVIIINRK